MAGKKDSQKNRATGSKLLASEDSPIDAAEVKTTADEPTQDKPAANAEKSAKSGKKNPKPKKPKKDDKKSGEKAKKTKDQDKKNKKPNQTSRLEALEERMQSLEDSVTTQLLDISQRVR